VATATASSSLNRSAWLVNVLLGAVGSWTIVLSAGDIGAVPRPLNYRWPIGLHGLSYVSAHVILYVGVSWLLISWLRLGVMARDGALGPRRVAWSFVALASPFLIGVPVFSRDVYSYVAQGLVAAHGHNPYFFSPNSLRSPVVVQSVADVWQHTPSPYGPLLTVLGHLVGLTGGSLVQQVLTYRLVAIGGLIVAALLVKPLARHRGTNVDLARWLILLSPLSLIAVVSSAHNDIFMIDLILAAFVMADRENMTWAFVAAGLAATIKLPALVVTVYFLAERWRSESGKERGRDITVALVSTALALVVPTTLASYGWHWLTPSVLKIPASIHTWMTPSIALGSLLHTVSRISLSRAIAICQVASELAVAVVAMVLMLRTKHRDLALTAGCALLIIVIGNATIWPWYFLWGCAALAVTRLQQRGWLAGLVGLVMFSVGPGGTPLVGPPSFWVTCPLLVIWLVWALRHQRAANFLREVTRA
jgi:Glycosyltransferase family 87